MADKDSMDLPTGFTCGDCFAFRHCSSLGITERDRKTCDWYPVRFRVSLDKVRSLSRSLEGALGVNKDQADCIAGLTEKITRLKSLLREIYGELGAALVQSLPTDDQIILDHVRRAHELAKEFL